MSVLPLLYVFLRKGSLVLCLMEFVALSAAGQSETHDFVTYDTTIRFTCKAGTPGCVIDTADVFTVRISRPRNYFVAGSPDTASRPWIVTTSGLGEIGTDTTYLTKYGPFFWLNNGWDGGVMLGNGKHYPILVTFIQTTANTRPAFLQAFFDTLFKYYHPRPHSVHMAALSEGIEVLGWYLGYEQTPGDEHNMANIRSFTDLEGQTPSGPFVGADSMAYPAFFGHWAKKYGGRFFGLQGTADDHIVWQISENMNDSVAGSAYFSWQNIGGGAHCCWNSMYDPGMTNWQCDSPVGNQYLQRVPAHPNTMGDYSYDPTTGSNVFQWMLRQGDTTLVGSAPPPSPAAPVVNAGADVTITLPDDSVMLSGTATDTSGSIVSWLWTETKGGMATIVSPDEAGTWVRGLTAGSYAFVLDATDNNGKSGSDTVTVTVQPAAVVTPPPPAPPVVNAGADVTITLPDDSVMLSGTATDTSGTIVSWLWTETKGGMATIVSPDEAGTWVRGLTAGSYAFVLDATDNNGKSGNDTVTVTVQPAAVVTPPPPAAPVVNAGADVTITLPDDSVMLSGTATDTSGSIVSWLWTETKGGMATIVSPDEAGTWVRGLTAGSYAFVLGATDNNGKSGNDTVTVTVQPAAVVTPPPPVKPGPVIVTTAGNQYVTLPPDTAVITGHATVTNSIIVGYEWTQIAGPACTVQSSSTATAMISGLRLGVYAFVLSAIDSNGDKGSDTLHLIAFGAAGSGNDTTSHGGAPPNDSTKEQPISIYPNPTTGILTVSFQNGIYGKIDLSILDAVGRTMKKYEFTKQNFLFCEQLNLTDMEKGVYLLLLTMEGHQWTKPVIRF